MGTYTSDNSLCEKVVWQANGRRLLAENFDKENVDELIKICQICQYFPHQNFAPYSTFNDPYSSFLYYQFFLKI